jgi:hypothetical protein
MATPTKFGSVERGLNAGALPSRISLAILGKHRSLAAADVEITFRSLGAIANDSIEDLLRAFNTAIPRVHLIEIFESMADVDWPISRSVEFIKPLRFGTG